MSAGVGRVDSVAGVGTSRRQGERRPSDSFASVLPSPGGIGGSTDVTECDREPIHIPGSVQPHGALLVLAEDTLTIRRASANATSFVGVDAAALIGSPLARALGPDGAELVTTAVRRISTVRIGPLVLDLTGLADDVVTVRTCDLTLHRNAPGEIILEIEENLPVEPTRLDVPGALLRLQSAPNGSLLQQGVVEVARLTGFERVMLYRFNALGDGEVLAEQLADTAESYLGLHYPGSDIPRQARELYRRQWLRLIVSSDYVPSPLLPQGEHEPVDLSHAALRSVSPVHLQYLRNMGVASSMSMSVVVEDQLWGLILCHGSTAHRVPSALRTACENIAQFISLQVESRTVTARLTAELRTQRLRTALIDQITNPVPALGLVAGSDDAVTAVGLLDILGADGAAGRLQGHTVVIRNVLDARTADRLVDVLRAEDGPAGPEGWSTSSLRVDAPAAARLLDEAGINTVAGLLLSPRPAGADDNYLLWVRREVEQTVNWAGEPTVKHQSGSLSPRASFALWREQVRDQSAPWQSVDVDAVADVAEAVSAQLRRLEERRLAEAAVRDVQLFHREHEIADALQRAMLPDLPELDGLTLTASYVSASESAEVGGDWYDAFSMPDGAIGIAMGDVTGHDLSAAAAMGQLRSILRSYAWEESGPEQVLDKVDALVSGFQMRHLATVFFGRLERDADGARLLRYANAGHLPPLLRLPDGSVELLDEGVSVLIGVGLGIAHEAATRLIPDGSTLLLYTDGLVERRTRGVTEGIEQLKALVAEGPREADALREHVLAGMVPGHREDDIAVLVICVAG